MSSYPTMAARFHGGAPHITGIPPEAVTAVLILVFPDESMSTSVPKGSDQQAEVAVAAAANVYGLGPEDEPSMLDQVINPFVSNGSQSTEH